MSKKIYFLYIFFFSFFASNFVKAMEVKKESDLKHTYFVQAPFNMAIIDNIQRKLALKIDNIFQEIENEEGIDLKPKENIALFFFKKRAAITVYYVNDMYVNAEPFLFSSLDTLKNIPVPKDVTVSSKFDFFGEPKEDLIAIIDLVVKIDDPSEGLLLFNKETKNAVHNANEQYQGIYHIDMYDIAKSEKYSYLPHLTLGHLRPNYIRHLINDSSRAKGIIERIKQGIIEAASQVLSELSLEDKKVFFDKLSIYDLQKRIYVHDTLLTTYNKL